MRPAESSGRRSHREARCRSRRSSTAASFRATSPSTTAPIVAVGLEPGGSGIAAPGFVDLQVNGFAGVDFLGADAEGFSAAGEALLETGVTAYLPTLITSAEEDMVRALQAIPNGNHGPRDPRRAPRGPVPLPASARHAQPRRAARSRRGASRAAARRRARPARDARAGAPGALDLVDLLHARGITVSLGHTNATADEAKAAFDRGVRTVTHVFNAMRPLAHRDPGIVGAALVRPDVVVQAIVDGVHLDPDIVRLLWRLAGGRIALVTDAIAGAGLGDGTYALGETEIVVADDVVRREDGVLAGSALTMPQAVRNLVEVGVALEDALARGERCSRPRPRPRRHRAARSRRPGRRRRPRRLARGRADDRGR